MARPITLVTGQWADLPLEVLAAKAHSFGFDGLELATWGDHFLVDQALAQPDYCAKQREVLQKYGMQVFAISGHLVGHSVLDPIDQRHRGIVPPYVWGDGDPAGVNQRAADELRLCTTTSAKSAPADLASVER